MLVEHALRVAGGAGGVAEGACRPLVEVPPDDVGRMLLDQVLVAERAGIVGLPHVFAVGQHNDLLDLRQLVAVLLQDRQEGQIDEEDTVLCVVHDVAELLGEQPRVQRVANRADTHDPVPGLDVTGAVPGQGPDPVAGLDAQSQERVREPARAVMDLAPVRAHDRPLDRAADHFAVAVPVLGVVEDLVDRERPSLHQALHEGSSLSFGRRATVTGVHSFIAQELLRIKAGDGPRLARALARIGEALVQAERPVAPELDRKWMEAVA